MKVVVLTGKFGMGHYSVSASLKDTITDRFENSEVEIVDFFEYAMPKFHEKLYKTFNLFVKNTTGLYNMVQKIADKKNAETPALVLPYFAEKIRSLIEEYKPDVIISTFPICSQVVSNYKEHYFSNLPLVTCITDISSKNEWLAKNTDSYMVPCKQVKDELIEKGIDPSIIQILGIPVKKEFKDLNAVSLNIESESEKSEEKEILLMGGGLGLLPKHMSFYEELDRIPGVRATVITGKNQKLYMKLKDRFENIEVVSYTNEVHKYMKRADVIVTKPGGITLFETIFSETPIFAFSPELPNEEHNVDFIEENQIGLVLNKDEKKSIAIIKNAIMDDELIETYKENMKKIQASFDTNAVLKLLNNIENSRIAYNREISSGSGDQDFMFEHFAY